MTQIDILEQLSENSIELTKKENNYYYFETIVSENKHKKQKNKFLVWSMFIFKYILTSSFIFFILLVWTNYSAYINIAKSYFMSEDIKKEQIWILNSVEASNLKEKIVKNTIKETKELKKLEEKEENKKSDISIKKYKKELENTKVNLDIEITPYENRIIIPKIAKNIPLVDIENRTIKEKNELDDIFMKELEKWVIRYPWSAFPWEKWNSFIFWHSSNFPWMKWNYNDVFSTLDNLTFDDKIIVYYWQKKFVYKIREKHVISPKDVSILKRDKNKKEISIMTCWPIWTTLNRLVVIWELISDEK